MATNDVLRKACVEWFGDAPFQTAKFYFNFFICDLEKGLVREHSESSDFLADDAEINYGEKGRNFLYSVLNTPGIRSIKVSRDQLTVYRFQPESWEPLAELVRGKIETSFKPIEVVIPARSRRGHK